MIKKKAQVISLYDILAILILVVMMIFWMMVLKPPIKQNSIEIREKIHFLDDDDNLMTFLKTPVEDYTLFELIIDEKEKNDNEQIINELNYLTSQVFGPVCWELIINDESYAKTKCNKLLNEELMRSSILLPYNQDEVIKIELIVPGYLE